MTTIITAALAISTWFTPTEEPVISGTLKYYGEGVMEQVAVNRSFITDTQQYQTWLLSQGLDGAAALMRKGDIGRTFTLVGPQGEQFRLISIDCAEKKHFLRRVEQGDILEVGWDIAQKLGMRGLVWGKVVFDVPQVRNDPAFRPE